MWPLIRVLLPHFFSDFNGKTWLVAQWVGTGVGTGTYV